MAAADAAAVSAMVGVERPKREIPNDLGTGPLALKTERLSLASLFWVERSSVCWRDGFCSGALFLRSRLLEE